MLCLQKHSHSLWLTSWKTLVVFSLLKYYFCYMQHNVWNMFSFKLTKYLLCETVLQCNVWEFVTSNEEYFLLTTGLNHIRGKKICNFRNGFQCTIKMVFFSLSCSLSCNETPYSSTTALVLSRTPKYTFYTVPSLLCPTFCF